MAERLDPQTQLTINNFILLLQGPDTPSRDEVSAYVESRRDDTWAEFLNAAVAVDPSFCHLFPRRANPSYPWRYHALANSVSRGFHLVRDDVSETDLPAWKSWLCRWLLQRDIKIFLGEEPLEAIIGTVMSGEDLATSLGSAPSRFVNACETSRLISSRLCLA